MLILSFKEGHDGAAAAEIAAGALDRLPRPPDVVAIGGRILFVTKRER